MPATLEAIVTGSALTIRAWEDPVVDALGHDPRSEYVERFWLPVLGPPSTSNGALKRASPEGSIDSSGGLTRHDGLGEAPRLWRSPSSTASSVALQRRCASTGWTPWPRTPRSSCCAISCPCSSARSPVPASPGRIERSSVPSLASSPVSGGHASSSRPRRSFAGIAPSFGGDGPTPTGGPAVRPCPTRPSSRSSAWPREPDLGLPAHPWRACHHGHRARAFQRLGDPETPPHRPRAETLGPHLSRVPPRAGHGPDRL